MSTILGTNGLNSADVPLSNKQSNKQTDYKSSLTKAVLPETIVVKHTATGLEI